LAQRVPIGSPGVWVAKYEKLRALKRKDDPDNFFSYSQNISPLPAGPAEPHAGELGLGGRG
jgi:hypothetical protein